MRPKPKDQPPVTGAWSPFDLPIAQFTTPSTTPAVSPGERAPEARLPVPPTARYEAAATRGPYPGQPKPCRARDKPDLQRLQPERGMTATLVPASTGGCPAGSSTRTFQLMRDRSMLDFWPGRRLTRQPS